MNKVQNIHVKTDDLIGFIDLDKKGYGRIYYYNLGKKKLWDNESEFLEITPNRIAYEVTHATLGKSAMVFEDGQATPLDLSDTAAVKQGLFKENKELLGPIIDLTPDDLVARLAKVIIIAEKSPVNG